jgi:hypothetical protein
VFIARRCDVDDHVAVDWLGFRWLNCSHCRAK